VDRAAFLEEIREHGDEGDLAVAERIFDWAKQHRMRDSWHVRPSEHGEVFTPILKGIEWEPVVIEVGSTPPRLFLSGLNLRRHYPFKVEAKWQEVLDRLYVIPQVVPTEQNFYPYVELAAAASIPSGHGLRPQITLNPVEVCDHPTSATALACARFKRTSILVVLD